MQVKQFPQFIHPWPEAMVTYLREDKILFSCDIFGSHIASTDLFVTDEGRVYEAPIRQDYLLAASVLAGGAKVPFARNW